MAPNMYRGNTQNTNPSPIRNNQFITDIATVEIEPGKS